MISRRMRRPLRRRMRHLRRFIMHNVLHADDPPHRLALGVAIGMFVAFTPTIGLQMVLAAFVAWLLRANAPITAPIVWISNPATMVPIYYWCYFLGRKILREPGKGAEWWAEFAHPPGGWLAGVSFYWSKFIDIAAPLWVGSLLVATVLAYLSYYLSYYAICSYRMRRWGQLTPPLAASANGAAGKKKAAPQSVVE